MSAQELRLARVIPLKEARREIALSRTTHLMTSQPPSNAIVPHYRIHAPIKKQDGRRIPRRDSWMVRDNDTGEVLGTFPTGAAASRAATLFRITRGIVPKISRILDQK